MTTAIVGTGSIGSALATLLVRGGEDVVLAARTPDGAQAAARRTGTRSATVEEAIGAADVVILAVWFDVARELLATHRDALGGKIVVDPSNPVAFDADGGFVKTIGEDESAGTILATEAPAGTAVVKAFGTMAATTLADSSGRTPGVAQFYAGDEGARGHGRPPDPCGRVRPGPRRRHRPVHPPGGLRRPPRAHPRQNPHRRRSTPTRLSSTTTENHHP
ncbi:NADPH-dependent F420 reductase [Nonomuraea diastatica]|uniref:Pyrroline-5-carboxylate reductase catalytic N-terminal domain-containing protein n=1 Tax=Nonomuraea diastatica TaxID=1848329 RepID=A0A4R4WGP7_9ACTN|nr:NAD(P)-binding domain-containing protein [Nonomuraea diastatica]TDD15483.1 hypothetical protein E1294_34245 [Nonomuraea diastatica]